MMSQQTPDKKEQPVKVTMNRKQRRTMEKKIRQAPTNSKGKKRA